MYNVKHRYVIRLKLGDKFLTFLTNLVVKEKSSIYSAIKEYLLLQCRKFLAFSGVVIM